MIYVKSIIGGVITGIISILIYAAVMAARYQGQQGAVGINIAALLPLAILAIGFIAGFYLVFRISH